MSKKISFVIPCYRSEKTIEKVIDEVISFVSEVAEYDYEIIAVDDFSPDRVFDILCMRAKKDSKIKVLSFAKNFGQHAGMIAGAKVSTGDYVVFLDDDGQCPIDRLEDLIQPLEQEWDITIAQYGKKKQSIFKNICSFINEFVANMLIDKPEDIQMGNFMAVNHLVIEEMRKYKGPYPYVSGLLFRTSRRVINVPMQERERMEGRTTYTLKKLFELWVNSFTAFSVKPLRMAIFLGSAASLIGICYGVVIIIRKLFNPMIAAGWSSMMAVLLLLGGMILFVLGLIGEYVGRIYMSLNGTPQYVIRESVNIDWGNNE